SCRYLRRAFEHVNPPERAACASDRAVLQSAGFFRADEDQRRMSTAPVFKRARRPTRQFKIGHVPIGGNAPVVLQSMTSTYTYDIDATVAQINRCAAAGCDVMRVAVPDPEDTAALPEIL